VFPNTENRTNSGNSREERAFTMKWTFRKTGLLTIGFLLFLIISGASSLLLLRNTTILTRESIKFANKIMHHAEKIELLELERHLALGRLMRYGTEQTEEIAKERLQDMRIVNENTRLSDEEIKMLKKYRET